MTGSSAPMRLWVRPEVLELGVIPILPLDKISLESLSRLLQNAKDLGLEGYPTISYENWKQLAKKMSIGDECSDVIFTSCRLFSQRFASDQLQDLVTSSSCISTLEMISLLYLQRVSNAHPRLVAIQASLQSLTNDPWPGAVHLQVPVAADNNSQSALHSRKKLQEEYNLTFMKDSLSELLSLLAGHVIVEETQSKAQKRRSGEWRSMRELLSVMRGAGVVDVEVVRAMDFVIGVTVNGRLQTKLLDVATDGNNSYQSGFLSKKNTFQKGLFEQWVTSQLDWCPHGERLCLQRGKKPPDWPVSTDHNHWKLRSEPPLTESCEKLVCIADLAEAITVQLGDASTNTTPKKVLLSEKLSMPLSIERKEENVSDKMCRLLTDDEKTEEMKKVSLFRSTSNPFSSSEEEKSEEQLMHTSLDLKIRRCSKSQIYVLRPLRHALLHKLYDCKVVLGPVRGRLRVSECRNTQIICPARSVVISDCRGVTVYTLTPQRPLLVGGVYGSSASVHQLVTMAPLNLHYPKLLQHMSMCELRTHKNMWNMPLKLGNDGSSMPTDCNLLSPEDFQLLSLPFFPATVDGRPPLLPPGLPPDYCHSISLCQETVCSLRQEIRESDLSPEQRTVLHKCIDQRFKNWLKKTNKQRELDLLNKLSAKIKMEGMVV